jgi:hypothetical protein
VSPYQCWLYMFPYQCWLYVSPSQCLLYMFPYQCWLYVFTYQCWLYVSPYQLMLHGYMCPNTIADWLIDYLLFCVLLKNYSLTWRRHYCRWRAEKFKPICWVLRAFEQGGIFIVPHLLWHGTSVFPVSSEVLPHSVASYDTQGVCVGPILTRILTGSNTD